MNDNLLSVRNLSVSFKTNNKTIHAVDKIDFDIKENEIFALVGESGCGKSTTALALMRLISKPGNIDRGEVLFNGKDIMKLKENEMQHIRGKEIGMIFQNPLDSLNPVHTIGSQVSEAILLDNVKKSDAIKKAINIFNDVRIPDSKERAKSYPYELSGGMRQRVMIGMMLSRNPRLLIADEPTTALDVTIQSQILDLIKDMRHSFGTSVLIITHDFGVVAEIADRVGVMYAGKIVETGSVYQIFDNAAHPYTKSLMKALPRITKNQGRLETIPGSIPNLAKPPEGCRFNERCPYARKICKVKSPGVKEIEKGHLYSCHLEV